MVAKRSHSGDCFTSDLGLINFGGFLRTDHVTHTLPMLPLELLHKEHGQRSRIPSSSTLKVSSGKEHSLMIKFN